MKDKFVFIAKFLFFSVILFILWIFIGRYYLILLANVSKFILSFMGYNATLVVNENIMFTCMGAEMGLTHSYLTNYNIIPFIALVLATPISKWRMGKILLIGLPIIFLFHMVDLVAHFPLYYEGSSFANMIISLSAVTRMVIPFFLWFALTYEYILKSFRKQKKKYRCPICDRETVGIMMHIKDSHKNMDEQDKGKRDRFLAKHPELDKP